MLVPLFVLYILIYDSTVELFIGNSFKDERCYD